jgi:nucleotidyltransferase-like protein
MLGDAKQQATGLARRVLLDALAALQDHRAAVILVGAQAIYLHTGAGDLAVATYTSDADLVLNPLVLADDPKLDSLLAAAGFVRSTDPSQLGAWLGSHGVPVDLMVPAALAGTGRRSADLGAHGNRVARRARGLEATLVDNTVMALAAFEPDDRRSFEVTVAGPAALLVAKLHKIWERRDNPRRLEDKDALDAFRLLRALPTELLANRLHLLLTDRLAGEVSREAIQFLTVLFGGLEATGTQMAVRATEGLEDPGTLAASCVALADDLLLALNA